MKINLRKIFLWPSDGGNFFFLNKTQYQQSNNNLFRKNATKIILKCIFPFILTILSKFPREMGAIFAFFWNNIYEYKINGIKSLQLNVKISEKTNQKCF